MPEARRRILTLACAAAVVLTAGGTTRATWSDSGVIRGIPIQTGTVHLQVDGKDAIDDFASLDLPGLEPGGAVATTLRVTNTGTVPASWTATISTGAAGTLAGALTTRITDATSTDGSTCGGTTLSGASTLEQGATSTICVALALPADAPASLAGASADLTISARGTTVRGDWPDTAQVAGNQVSTAALTAPALSCVSKVLSWSKVPDATGYRVYLAGVEVLRLGANDLSTALNPLWSTGLLTVRAVFGSDSWISPPSNSISVLTC